MDSCAYAVYGYDVQAEVIGMKGAAFVGIGERYATTILDEAVTMENILLHTQSALDRRTTTSWRTL